jgi:hypothetical protein
LRQNKKIEVREGRGYNSGGNGVWVVHYATDDKNVVGLGW